MVSWLLHIVNRMQLCVSSNGFGVYPYAVLVCFSDEVTACAVMCNKGKLC